jgi:hypothetical protein
VIALFISKIIVGQAFGSMLTILSHVLYIMRIMFMQTTARQEEEDLPEADGTMVLDDLPLADAARSDAATAPRDSAAFVACALNEMAPRIETVRRQGSKRAAALSEFGKTLRRLVNQWLDSGKDNGIDEPQQRDILWRSSQYPEPIFTTLITFWERNRPRAIVGRDGRFTLELEPKPWLNPKQLSENAHDRAIWVFQQFLQSRQRDLLSRCDFCQRYFVRARKPKKDMPIKRGTFCENCKGIGGARRTVASREQRKKEMVGRAADCWLKWKPRHGKQEEWIAKQVNRELDKHHRIHDPITRKWVTQNKKSIKAEVKRRNDAKG